MSNHAWASQGLILGGALGKEDPAQGMHGEEEDRWNDNMMTEEAPNHSERE
jgi:hypothetical protein